jgi:hypothetical protein
MKLERKPHEIGPVPAPRIPALVNLYESVGLRLLDDAAI